MFWTSSIVSYCCCLSCSYSHAFTIQSRKPSIKHCFCYFQLFWNKNRNRKSLKKFCLLVFCGIAWWNVSSFFCFIISYFLFMFDYICPVLQQCLIRIMWTIWFWWRSKTKTKRKKQLRSKKILRWLLQPTITKIDKINYEKYVRKSFGRNYSNFMLSRMFLILLVLRAFWDIINNFIHARVELTTWRSQNLDCAEII